MQDQYNLQRYLDAQDPVYSRVTDELRNGRKQTHWMWFVFPQLRGLGQSTMSVHFALTSRAEAEAYLAHPILGARLKECTRLVNEVKGRSATQIFGPPDDLKFQSSMTLFAAIAPAAPAFREALANYFDGARDEWTVSHLD